MRGHLALAWLLAAASGGEALAQRAHPPARNDKPAAPAAAAPASPAPPPEARAYDPQLMRLSEILGALTYLGQLCGEKNSDEWRQRMQALLDAEGQPAQRRDRLAGAYNEGLRGYELSYRSCTNNARAVIGRFLAEGSRLAQDVENRYRAS